MKPSLHFGMPASVYHSDQDGPRLSQSLATLCCNKSPLHAWQAHPLLGSAGPYSYEASDDDGTIIHTLVLEPESEQIFEVQVMGKDGEYVSDFRTNAAKNERDAALARGQIPILPEKLAIFRYKAKAIRSRLERGGTLFDGDSEVVIYWSEETPYGPIPCRCRIDHLTVTDAGATIIDLKTTKDAHPNSLKRSIWEYGYDLQHAAYTRAVAAMFPELAGRIRMGFAFAELDKPYAVNPIELSGEFKRLGEARWERGRDRWAKCAYERNWTGYEGGTIEPPAYASAQEMVEL